MIAAATTMHRQGGFIRVRLFVGPNARRDRNAWVNAGNTRRAIKLEHVDVALRMLNKQGVRTAYVTVNGIDKGVKDIATDWRKSLSVIAANAA